MRDVWRYSPQHKEAINKCLFMSNLGDKQFLCPICKKEWPIELAAVDHNPPLGSFDSWKTFADWTERLFEGNVRVLDKMCHKKITAQQHKRRVN